MPERPDSLTFGIVIEWFPMLEVWQRICLERLLHPGVADLRLVIVLTAPREERSPTNRWTTMYALWKLYEKACVRKIPMKKKEDASRLIRHFDVIKDVDDLLLESPRSPQSIHHIKRYALHFILNLTPHALKADLEEATLYGVWTYRHGRRQQTVPAPPCFGEILHHDPTTESFLYAAQQGRIITLHSGTFKNEWNYSATLNNVLAASADWVSRACRQILSMGMNSFPQH